MIDWITNHLDAVLTGIFFISGMCAYWIGKEIGYEEGLEDGFKDGQLNASRP